MRLMSTKSSLMSVQINLYDKVATSCVGHDLGRRQFEESRKVSYSKNKNTNNYTSSSSNL